MILTTINYITKKTQLTNGQRYDMIKRKRTFQTSWKEKIHWVEASGRLITPAILSRWIVNFRRHFLLCTCISGSLISTRLLAIMLIAQDKMKSRFYEIKCTAVSDQVLNCQPKIVILNNICHSVTTTSMLILCSTNFISSIPIFRTSRQMFRTSRFLVLKS